MSTVQPLQFQTMRAVPGFAHAITTRSGGVSEGEYASLNLGFHVADDAAAVRGNRRRLAAALGYRAEDLVAAEQVHGAAAALVTSAHRGRGALDRESALPGVDSLIVTEAALPALILVADCAPVLLVHPPTGAFAVMHAGWRGAVGRICSKTVAAMAEQCGAPPGELLAGIGPHLCARCFEIGPEVADAASLVAPHAVLAGAARPHLDLAALLNADLSEAGLLSHNREVMPHCPQCENHLFFSHRAQGGRAGRFGLIAWRTGPEV